MVVGAKTKPVVRSDDRQIVLSLIGIRVFAPTPLGQFSVVANAHDGSPTGCSASVACVIGHAACAIVRQTKRVADLVAGRFCRGLLFSVRKVVLKDKRRCVAIPVKGRQIGDSSRRPEPRTVTANGDSNAPLLIVAAAPDELVLCRFLSRNVHIEGDEVFSHALPDTLDSFELCRAECRIAVDRVRGCHDRADVPEAVPRCAACRHAVEVEIDSVGCARFAVQLKCLPKWERCCFTCRGTGRVRLCFGGHENGDRVCVVSVTRGVELHVAALIRKRDLRCANVVGEGDCCRRKEPNLLKLFNARRGTCAEPAHASSY